MGCANDGIVATAGIVEGLSASAEGRHTVVLAAAIALLVGGLSLGGAIYAEYAAQRDALTSTIEEEQSLLRRLPGAELEELQRLYVERGLTPELAAEVAAQLSARDPLAAHLEAEYGLSARAASPSPLAAGAAAALAFGVGAAIPLVATLFAPAAWRVPILFGAAILGLGATSAILVWAGTATVGRTFGRALIVGVLTMLAGLALGRVLP